MSERDGFMPGVPSWVDNMGSDAGLLKDFYGATFGWDFAGPGTVPGDPPAEYYVARLRGRDVAGLGKHGDRPGWTTHIEVESADRAAEAVAAAGGSVIADPCDADPAGRVAIVADPAGATFGIWEPRARRGAQVVNEPGAWSMSALNTDDLDAAASFYGSVFGWTTETFQLGDMDVTLFRLPGFVGGEPQQPVPRDVVATMLRLGDGDDAAAARPHWSVDFWVADLDATVAAASERGGKLRVPPYALPMMRQATLEDPDGAAFSVTQLVLDG